MYMLNSSASKAKQDFPYFSQTLTTYVLPPITVAFAEPQLVSDEGKPTSNVDDTLTSYHELHESHCC